MLLGWSRQVSKQRLASRRSVGYRAPCGRRMRNMHEVHRYLRLTGCQLGVDLFSFDQYVHCFTEFEPLVVYSRLNGTRLALGCVVWKRNDNRRRRRTEQTSPAARRTCASRASTRSTAATPSTSSTAPYGRRARASASTWTRASSSAATAPTTVRTRTSASAASSPSRSATVHLNDGDNDDDDRYAGHQVHG